MHNALVFGSNGLLGRGIMSELAAQRHDCTPAEIRWADFELATHDIHHALANFLSAVGDDDHWAIWWCAGAGVTASSQTVLDTEKATIDVFCKELNDLIALNPSLGHRGVVFFSSSAGGVYAGASDPPFTEMTTPLPIAPYGHYKLAEEALFTSLSKSVPVAIGRLSNLYGPGQNLAKQQGLISQLCAAHHLNRPVNVYVSLDTLRDYIYVHDAARLAVSFVSHVAELRPTAPVVKILASGWSVSIGQLLGQTTRVLKRKSLVVLGASSKAKQQARDLRLKSVVLPHLDDFIHTTLPSGIAATSEDIGYRIRNAM
jgi:UDP-glucose 4-epimerase